jgi:hypothetical protein
VDVCFFKRIKGYRKMEIDELIQNCSINEWHNYEPWDPHYYNFPPHVIFAAHKIGDVYQSMTNARFYLSYLEIENYGELIAEHDEIHLAFIRSSLLQSALSFYNYCIDLSWQVLWFYFGASKYRLYDENYYDEQAKNCNRENLRVRLHLAHFDHINSHLDEFSGEQQFTKVRTKYNYLKHRGTFFTPGAGVQYSHLTGGVNGRSFRMVERDVFDIQEWKTTLIAFDESFFCYFQQIIDWIMPRNFITTEFSFVDVLKLNQNYKTDY